MKKKIITIGLIILVVLVLSIWAVGVALKDKTEIAVSQVETTEETSENESKGDLDLPENTEIEDDTEMETPNEDVVEEPIEYEDEVEEPTPTVERAVLEKGKVGEAFLDLLLLQPEITTVEDLKKLPITDALESKIEANDNLLFDPEPVRKEIHITDTLVNDTNFIIEFNYRDADYKTNLYIAWGTFSDSRFDTVTFSSGRKLR